MALDYINDEQHSHIIWNEWTFINWIINRFSMFLFFILKCSDEAYSKPKCIPSFILEASAFEGNYGKLQPSICKLVFKVYIFAMWFHCFNWFWIPIQPQLLCVSNKGWNGKAIRYFRTMVEAIELNNAIHSMYALDAFTYTLSQTHRHRPIQQNVREITCGFGIFYFRKPNTNVW